jgi:hypothetical protein
MQPVRIRQERGGRGREGRGERGGEGKGEGGTASMRTRGSERAGGWEGEQDAFVRTGNVRGHSLLQLKRMPLSVRKRLFTPEVTL